MYLSLLLSSHWTFSNYSVISAWIMSIVKTNDFCDIPLNGGSIKMGVYAPPAEWNGNIGSRLVWLTVLQTPRCFLLNPTLPSMRLNAPPQPSGLRDSILIDRSWCPSAVPEYLRRTGVQSCMLPVFVGFPSLGKSQRCQILNKRNFCLP